MFGIVRERLQAACHSVREYGQRQAGVLVSVQGQEPTETHRGVHRTDVRHVACRRMEGMFGRMWQS